MSSGNPNGTLSPPIQVLKIQAVLKRTGLGRDSVYRLARAGKFPRPIKISERASGWLESEVEHYLSDRAAERSR